MVLAKDDSPAVRNFLAAATGVSPEAQLILAKDEFQSVRLTMVENTTISPEAQRILAQDESGHVLEALASNSAISPSIAEILLNGGNPDAIAGLLTNPHVNLSEESIAPHVENANANLLLSMSKRVDTPAMRKRANALLKELQQNPVVNAQDLSRLMQTGLIDIETIKDATNTGIIRWRRELGRILTRTTNEEKCLSAVARKIGISKETLSLMLKKSLGAELVADWVKRDHFSRKELEDAAGKPGLLHTNILERNGLQAPGLDRKDDALPFFNPDMDERIQDLFSKSGKASNHPPSFGFSLFRRFGEKDENVLMTEIQSDVLSCLFDKKKERDAQ
jgi:predicted DNA-binding protein (UPF0251 family)